MKFHRLDFCYKEEFMKEKTRWQPTMRHEAVNYYIKGEAEYILLFEYLASILLFVICCSTKFCFLLDIMPIFQHNVLDQKNASLKFYVQHSTLILPEYAQLCMLRYIQKQRLTHTCMKTEIRKSIVYLP